MRFFKNAPCTDFASISNFFRNQRKIGKCRTSTDLSKNRKPGFANSDIPGTNAMPTLPDYLMDFPANCKRFCNRATFPIAL